MRVFLCCAVVTFFTLAVVIGLIYLMNKPPGH
jgi:hypothetical protein